MESKAAELLAALKNVNLSIDAKAAHLTSVKSDIKQKNVPEYAVTPVFEALRLALTSQHSSLLGGGFSTLSHFLKRLFIQDQHHLISGQGRMLYPILLERLGDRKERTRAQAAQAFTDMWPAANADVEHYVLEIALVGKNARAREMSMIWLANMTKSHGLLFRAYVPSLVGCLEDADSAVRDTAKMTVVELFQNAPARAKSDLTKQITAHNVRKSIANSILTSIGLSSTDGDHSAPSRPASRAEALHQRPVSVMSSRSHYRVDSPEPEPVRPQRPMSRLDRERSAPPPQHVAADEHLDEAHGSQNDSDDIEPLIVASSRDLDDMVRDMLPWFEGRETEQNWVSRERNVIALRRLTRGNAPHSFPTQFLTAMKTLLDGIFKVVNSLRTTLCTAGCLMMQDLAKTCGPRIDSMVEIIMQNLIKLCSGMKKISAQSGNTTVDVVIGNVTFTSRIMQHITSAAQDRNAQLRLYAAGWIKTIIQRQARHKSSMEHAGGLDNLDKSIRKCLSDANPAVRETMRVTFWAFNSVWPRKGDEIISTLDSKSRSLLEKENPNADQSSLKTPSTSQKGLSSSTSSATSSRSALKEAIAAQKRARLTPGRSLPPRPESAQSTFSDARTTDPPPKSSTSTSTSAAVRTVPTGSSVSSLSSAPMRPGSRPRRPEITRPATADPYARRTGEDSRSTKASSAPKVDSSPRAVKGRSAATPSSKTPRRDPAHLGPTMSKPKKLDISKSRLHDQSANHSRSGSHDSMAHHGRESPASIQLESPPGSTIQRPVPAVEEPVPSLPALPPLRMQSVERSTPQPSREPTADLADDHVPSPDVIPNSVRKQPAPVQIYEDPVPAPAETPVETQNHAEAVPNEYYISADTLARDEEHKDGDDAGVMPDAPVVIEPESPHEPEPEPAQIDVEHPAPSSASPEIVAHDIPAVTPEPEPVSQEHESPVAVAPPETDIEQPDLAPYEEDPDSPSSVIHHPVTVTDVDYHESPTPSPRARTNENATPLANKSINISPEIRSAPRHNVLGEIPNNEPARDNRTPQPIAGKLRSPETMPTATPDVSRRWKKLESTKDRKRSISPRSKDSAKAREMLDKGMQRIRTKTMDILGYRKLQGLIEYHDAIFDDEAKYDEMLVALLNELESAPEERRASRSQDVKTQVLVTIRFLLRQNEKYFAAYYPKAMTALVSARKRYASSCHIVSGLEETAEEIIAGCPAAEVIEAVLDQIEHETQDEEGYRAVTMGTSVVSRLVKRINGGPSKGGMESGLVERIGGFCGRHLTDRQPDVRRQVTDLSVALYRVMEDESRYWEVMGSPRENSRNLLIYYIHK